MEHTKVVPYFGNEGIYTNTPHTGINTTTIQDGDQCRPDLPLVAATRPVIGSHIHTKTLASASAPALAMNGLDGWKATS